MRDLLTLPMLASLEGQIKRCSVLINDASIVDLVAPADLEGVLGLVQIDRMFVAWSERFEALENRSSNGVIPFGMCRPDEMISKTSATCLGHRPEGLRSNSRAPFVTHSQ